MDSERLFAETPVGSLFLRAAVPGSVVSLFLPDASEDLAQMTAHALRVFSLCYLTRWVSFAGQSFLVAVGWAREATAVSIAAPLALLALLWPLGLDGIWANAPLSALAAAILTCACLLRLVRLEKRG